MKNITNDSQIRRVLKDRVMQHDPTVVLANELPLQRNNGRADLAALNGSMVGYEIKSCRDSLQRLDNQITLYDSIFDYSFLVTTARHCERAAAMIPEHWGIQIAQFSGDELVIVQKRKAKKNQSVDSNSRLKLMWRDEVYRALVKYGIPCTSSMRISQLWKLANQALSRRRILEESLHALKLRKRLESDEPSA